MFKFFKKYREKVDGASAIEFSLVAMPFLIMIFGVMEAGNLVWTMNGVQYAVEETSRYAAINSDLGSSEFQGFAEGRMKDMMLSPVPLQVTTSTYTSNGINFIEVDGVYAHELLLGGFIPGDFGTLNFDRSAKKPIVE